VSASKELTKKEMEMGAGKEEKGSTIERNRAFLS
jgi:hypothetical protein